MPYSEGSSAGKTAFFVAFSLMRRGPEAGRPHSPAAVREPLSRTASGIDGLTPAAARPLSSLAHARSTAWLAHCRATTRGAMAKRRAEPESPSQDERPPPVERARGSLMIGRFPGDRRLALRSNPSLRRRLPEAGRLAPCAAARGGAFHGAHQRHNPRGLRISAEWREAPASPLRGGVGARRGSIGAPAVDLPETGQS